MPESPFVGRSSTSERIHVPELDGIRGWACLSVLIAHCFTGIVKTAPDSWFVQFNGHTLWLFLSGVDLFFVLSGFLIGGVLLDTRNHPHFFKNFWIRRAARIFPVYYLVFLTYALALFVTGTFGITRFDNWLLAEYRPPLWTFSVFMQSLPFALGGMSGPRWMAMTWSLAIEEQFYILFPFAVYFLRRKPVVLIVIAGIIIAPIMRDLLERVFGHWYGPYVLLPSRMDGLLFGVAIALIVRNEAAFRIVRRLRHVLDAVALLILYSIMSNWVFPWWQGPSGILYPLKQSLHGIMWAIVILRIFTYEKSHFNRIWRNVLLCRIGLVSYALYMYHQAINGLTHGILFNQEPTIAAPAHFLAAVFVVSLAGVLATLSYIYFESPIRRHGAALAARLPAHPPAPAVKQAI